MLKPPQCSEHLTKNDDDDINADFPSLQTAASHHEKKHNSSWSAAQARKLRECRRRTSDSTGSEHTVTDDQLHSEAAGYSAPESIPACSASVEYRHSALPVQNGIGVWKKLQPKSSNSDSNVAFTQRRKVPSDREPERPVSGISSSHSSRPLAPVSLEEFLGENRVSDADDGFSPSVFYCTRCGDPTHRYNECSVPLSETFCN